MVEDPVRGHGIDKGSECGRQVCAYVLVVLGREDVVLGKCSRGAGVANAAVVRNGGISGFDQEVPIWGREKRFDDQEILHEFVANHPALCHALLGRLQIVHHFDEKQHRALGPVSGLRTHDVEEIILRP